MLEIWFASGAVALLACILLIAMCTHEEEDIVPETKEEEKPSPIVQNGDAFFKDPLEEISENVNFHVIPNSNKKTRAQEREEKQSAKKKKVESESLSDSSTSSDYDSSTLSSEGTTGESYSYSTSS